MTNKELQRFISQGESETIEFKTSFSKEVIETVVAFANTKGGSIFIGVGDDGVILGVQISQETIQNWINQIKHNTSPQIIPDIDVCKIGNKNIY